MDISQKTQSLINEHEIWLKTDGKKGQQAIFSGMDLKNCDISKSNLENAYFGELYNDANSSDLYGANLAGAKLEGCNLRKADFNKCILQNANFTRADLRDTNFQRANLSDANLTEANIVGADLFKADLKNIILKYATVDLIAIAQLPANIVNKYKDTFIVSEGYQPNNVIEHVIRFPPEFYLSGMTILSYFSKIVRERFNENDVLVSIKQNGERIILLIETKDGEQRIEIERTLMEYNNVLLGEMSIDKFCKNEYEKIELKQQLQIAHSQLETQRQILALKDERIKDYENRIFSLEEKFNNLAQLFNSSLEKQANTVDLFNAIGNSLTVPMNETMQDAIKLIKNSLRLGEGKVDEELFKKGIIKIEKEDPGFINRLKNIIEKAIGGAAGSLIYKIIASIILSLPK